MKLMEIGKPDVINMSILLEWCGEDIIMNGTDVMKTNCEFRS